MVTEFVEPQSDQVSRRTVLWGVLNVAVIMLGLMAVLWGAGLAALSTNYLPLVNPSVGGHGVTTLAQPIDTTWVVTVVLAALGMVACAGLPSMRDAARGLNGAIGQGLGGMIAAGSSLLILVLILGASFTGAEDGCFYESCWPMREEGAALAFPSVVAGLLMVVAALLVRRVRWWVRAVVPAVGVGCGSGRPAGGLFPVAATHIRASTVMNPDRDRPKMCGQARLVHGGERTVIPHFARCHAGSRARPGVPQRDRATGRPKGP